MDTEIAINIKNLSKVYEFYDKPFDRLKEALSPLGKKYHKKFYALSNVSLTIKKGQTVGIIGKNGSGKSTLLKIIAGVLTPSTGSAEVKGRVSALLELGGGFNPDYSGLENIFLQGTLLGYKRESMQEKLEEILAFADIGEFVHQPVRTYSSGMFARLAFAVAINVDPEILIVDEVLSVGDAAFQKKCLDKINQIKKRGVTILFVSHDDYSVRLFCDSALYLHEGNQIFFGPSDEAVEKYLYDTRKKIKLDALKEYEKVSKSNFTIRIHEVTLLDLEGNKIDNIRTMDSLAIAFKYSIEGKYEGKLTFVVNLYRHDGLYISGATTVMDKLESYKPCSNGSVKIEFFNIPILTGTYNWRVAINDETALGIFAEAVPVCEFKVIDRMESVGIVHLNRKWTVEEAIGET